MIPIIISIGALLISAWTFWRSRASDWQTRFKALLREKHRVIERCSDMIIALSALEFDLRTVNSKDLMEGMDRVISQQLHVIPEAIKALRLISEELVILDSPSSWKELTQMEIDVEKGRFAAEDYHKTVLSYTNHLRVSLQKTTLTKDEDQP